MHDKAGERILERSVASVEEILPPGERILIYKNNTDGKGNSYGCHENYLVDRTIPFARIVRDLTPFFVTRQIFTGAGKVGTEGARGEGRRVTYQLSQRADFFEAEVGLETTLKHQHSRRTARRP
jgi:proteasome accessory factor A